MKATNMALMSSEKLHMFFPQYSFALAILVKLLLQQHTNCHSIATSQMLF